MGNLIFLGSNHAILWNFAHEEEGVLRWCIDDYFGFEYGYDPVVPIAVTGNTSQPFLLVSFPKPEPNLHALALDEDIQVEKFFCMFQNRTILSRNYYGRYELIGSKTVQDILAFEKYT